jgi:hypothetical protein
VAPLLDVLKTNPCREGLIAFGDVPETGEFALHGLSCMQRDTGCGFAVLGTVLAHEDHSELNLQCVGRGVGNAKNDFAVGVAGT